MDQVKRVLSMRKLMMILILLVAAPAQAGEWVEIGSDNDSVHYVDRDSLSREQDVVTLQKKVVYNEPQISAFTKGSEPVKYSLGTLQEDCTGRQHRVVSIDLYSEAGEVIWSSGRMNRVWESVEEDSVGANAHTLACGKSK
jgi:hypothetical protein